MWLEIINQRGCERVKPSGGYPEFYLFRVPDGTAWLVGRYTELTRLASDLRDNETLRSYIAEKKVRLGLRSSDIPPQNVERQKSYGSAIPGSTADYTSSRKQTMAQPVASQSPPSINRKSDREENVKTFWATQTPQSHHIVEFNNLETLGFSNEVGPRDQDYHKLPAVLLAAEFHQRYISAILRVARYMKTEQLGEEIATVYRHLYQGQSPLFEPLWRVSAVILANAGCKP